MLVNHGKCNIYNSKSEIIEMPMISASHLKPPADFPESSEKYKIFSGHPSVLLI